jgi:hypothetical protein
MYPTLRRKYRNNFRLLESGHVRTVSSADPIHQFGALPRRSQHREPLMQTPDDGRALLRFHLNIQQFLYFFLGQRVQRRRQ